MTDIDDLSPILPIKPYFSNFDFKPLPVKYYCDFCQRNGQCRGDEVGTHLNAINDALDFNKMVITKEKLIKLITMITQDDIPNDTTVISLVTTKTTAKQCFFIVQLLNNIGFENNELSKITMTNFRQKLSKKGIQLPDNIDDKTLIDWLRKGEIQR
ncbi:hypothetical protein [Citrobacter sp. FP75]|uniref:hypothetical protein n=1 Tax=Citrobacter sp. FP75 TaxID=1852949 RepID=UPI001BCA0C3C|nr:hypothetical protein [Citrobacter sp. FP75]